MIESTVIRMICGVSALKTVFSMENTSAIKNFGNTKIMVYVTQGTMRKYP